MAIQQGYSGTVGVVTPFRAQANRIRDLVNAHPHANLLLNKLELLIDTVHKFQGDERDVMIFSPVVSKGIADGAVGVSIGGPNDIAAAKDALAASA